MGIIVDINRIMIHTNLSANRTLAIQYSEPAHLAASRKKLRRNHIMGKSITSKILSNHLIDGTLEVGEEIAIKIDHALIQDTTGQLTMLQFEVMDVEKIKVERALIYADHNTIQVGPENMDDHLFLLTAGMKYGLFFSRPGNGICHQVNLERFSVPGKTLLGADSHTTTGGGGSMLAIGAGGLDVAAALAGKPFFLEMPEIVRITLEGQLQQWVSAKDIALEILRITGVSGGRGKIFEFAGSGVKKLTVPQRSTIANMSIETGAFTAIFPSDDMTRDFLKKQRRENDWTPLHADSDAIYDDEIHINLSTLEPMIAAPHSPDNVFPVREAVGIEVDQVGIGSCTNASLEDLSKASAILKGRTVAANTSLIITPGSRQTLKGLFLSGVLGDLIDSGARILENVCGFCCGLDQSPRSGGISLRTSNRNFPGRSGTTDAGIYLASPETAAATAITGKITDPRTMGEAPIFVYPKEFPIDDRMIIPPAPTNKEIHIHRGPNISKLPLFEKLPHHIKGMVLLKTKDNVTTDDILPGGAHILKLRGNIPSISQFVFSRIDPAFAERALKVENGFIIGGDNYGQGSSREHAALAPRYLGIRTIIAKSFARIHKSNLINFGILPLEFCDPADYELININDTLQLSNLIESIKNDQPLTINNLSSGAKIDTKMEIPVRLKRTIIAGGLLNQIRGNSL